MPASHEPDSHDPAPAIACLGWMAGRILSDLAPQKAAVIGVTSRGVFVLVGRRWVVFLSREAYRGPLTINLSGRLASLDRIELHDPVRIEKSRLSFPSGGFTLTIPDSAPWKAPPPSRLSLPVEEKNRFLSDVAEKLIVQKPNAGFGAVLARLVGSKVRVDWSDEHQHVDDVMRDAGQALRDRDVKKVVASLSGLLGRGTGLTPSGDDLAAGFLLAGERWKNERSTEIDFQGIKTALNTAAYEKTTTLSANLMECAGYGEADERLIDAVDGIRTGIPAAVKVADGLAAWGNSSGLDALLGMTLWMS